MTGHGDRRDAGFTLTEMIVGSALFAMVVLVAGSILVGMFSAQRQVGAITSTTTDAQLAGTVIDTGIRNSSGFKLTPVSDDQFLVARVAGTGASLQWECRAWYYSAATSTIRASSAVPGAPMATPTAAQLTSWSLLADGVRPRPGATAVFTAAGSTVTVSFDATTTDADRPVAIEFVSSPLAGVTENATCY